MARQARGGAGAAGTRVLAAPLAAALLRHYPGSNRVQLRTNTNQHQFQTLIDFMEQHGDLTRPKNGVRHSAQYRATMWGRLARALNAASPPGAPHRTVTKWQKVWSDLKNNTRKKALKMASSPAENSVQLSQSEYRVLKVMGMIKSSILSSVPPPRVQLVARRVSSGAVQALRHAEPEPEPDLDPDPDHDNFTTTFEAKLENPLSDSNMSELEADAEAEVSELEAGPAAERAIEDEMFSWPQPPSPPRPPSPPQRKRSRLTPDCVIVEECPPSAECILQGTVMDDNSVLLASAHALPSPSPCPRPSPAGPGPGPGLRPDVRGHTVARALGSGAKAQGERGALRRLTRELARTRRVRTRELRLQRGWQAICERGLALIERFVSLQTGGMAPSPCPPPAAEGPPPAHPLVLNPDRCPTSHQYAPTTSLLPI